MKNLRLKINKINIQNKSVIFASICLFILSFVFVPQVANSAQTTFTNSLTTTGLTLAAPSVPASLTATAVSSTQIDLSWSASIANYYPIAGYRIFRDGVFLATTTSITYSDTGLSPETNYDYNVEAFDTLIQLSGQSTMATATTTATPVATPTPTPGSNGGGGGGSGSAGIIISNIKIIPGTNQAEVSFVTSIQTQANLVWGFTNDFEAGSLQGLVYSYEHTQVITGLTEGLTYQLKITARGSNGETVSKNISFTTVLPVSELSPLPNPSDFVAQPGDNNISLSWINPTDSRFNDVRIVRTEGFYPIDQYDGLPLYEGDGESFIDTTAKPGVTYYYAIFSRDRSTQYSSGALAQARIALPGEIATTTIADPFANIPQAKNVDPRIRALTLSDFEFVQDGKNLATVGETVAINGDKNLTIRLKYEKVPEILKTVAFTLKDPNDSTRVFPFLLRINSDKTYYEATIGALGKSGRYGMSVTILDYENNGLMRLDGTLAALAFTPVISFSSGFDFFGLLILLLIIILIILAIILVRKWLYYSPENSREYPNNQKKALASVFVLIITNVILFSSFFGINKVFAAFNSQINYQGKLTNSSNSIVSDGNYNIRFKLYTSLSGGVPIWTETWCNTSDCAGTGVGADNRIPLVSGLFSTMLGSTTPLTGIDFNQPLYLGVEIGGSGAVASWDGEMSPRKILGAVPAAFVAQSANTLSGLNSTEFFRTDAQNATSSASTFLNIVQTGAGKIAEFFGSASQTVLAILSNGNVGIGASSPNAKLDINGLLTSGFVVSNPTALISDNTNGIAGVNMINTNTGTAADFRFAIQDTTGNYTAFTLPSVNNNGSTLFGLARSEGTFIFNNGGTPRNMGIGTLGATNLVLGTNNAAVMTLTAGGNVGIGTTSPSQNLSVQGNALISGNITGANITATGTATLANLLLSGSTTLQNFTALNGTTTNSTSTSLFASSLISTNATSTTFFSNILNGASSTLSSLTVGQITAGNLIATSTATSTFTGGLYASLISAPYFHATSSTATSTFAGGIQANNMINVSAGNSYLYNGAVLANAITSLNNYFFGEAGNLTMSGNKNIAIGYQALSLNNTGSQNVAIGHNSSKSNVGGISNTAIGYNSFLNGTGSNNTAIGFNTLAAALGTNTGTQNTAVGGSALAANTSGLNNTALGYHAGLSIDTGSNNILIGVNAGDAITGGSNNIILGYNIDAPLSSGSNQLDIGNLIYGTGLTSSGSTVSSGFIGIGSTTPATRFVVAGNSYFDGDIGVANINATGTVSVNNLIATSSLKLSYAGIDMLVSTDSTGKLVSTSTPQVASINATSTATSTFAGGLDVLAINQTGSASSTFANGINLSTGCFAISGTCIGSGSGSGTVNSGTTGQFAFYGANGTVVSATSSIFVSSASRIGIGSTTPWAKLSINPVAGDGPSFAIGSSTGTKFVVSNSGSVGIGTTTPYAKLSIVAASATSPAFSISNSDGSSAFEIRSGGVNADNTFIGLGSGMSNVNGDSNTTLGNYALLSNTTGYSNIAVGVNALRANTVGDGNVAMGDRSLWSNTSGRYNTAFGTYSLISNITGENNTAIGAEALYNNVSGTSSVAVGTYAGYGQVGFSSASSTFIGTFSGYNISSGIGNTFLGYMSGYNVSSGSNNIVIGQNVDAPSATANQQLNIGNIIYGTNIYGGQTLSSTPASNGRIGIGTSSPYSKFAIHANSDDTNTTLFSIASSTSNSTTTLFAVLNSGNVGVGTTSPSKTLAVQGNSYVSGTSFFGGAITATSTLNVTGLTTLGNASTTQIGSTGSAYFATLGGSLGVGTTSPWANLSVNGTSTQTVIPLFAVASSTGSATSTAFIIDANGKVGIGTTSPSQQLSIAGGIFTTGSSTMMNGIDLTSGCFSINGTCLGSGSGTVNSGTTGQFAFYGANGTAVSATSSIFVSSDSKIGIGTTSPWAKLSINPVTGDGPSFVIGSSTATKFVVDNAGNVGVGTASPYAKLSIVAASATSPAFSISNSDNSKALEIRSGGANVDNIFIGVNSGAANVSGNSNTTLGNNALLSNTSGYSNAAMGLNTLRFNTSGYGNVAIGDTSLYVNTQGYYNTAVGFYSLKSNVTGTDNTAIGALALYNNVSATSSVALGSSAGFGQAGFSNASSTFIGTMSGYNISSGLGNTFLGYMSGYNISSGSNNIVIGQNVDVPSATANQQLNIGNIIYGTNIYGGQSLSSAPALNGRIGIGTSSPYSKFAIHANNNDTDTTLFSIASSTSNSTTTLFAVLNSGNVGVGTTSPWAKLSINPVVGDGPSFAIGSSTATKFVVDNAGDVGIGISNPSAILDIARSGDDALINSTVYEPSPQSYHAGLIGRKAEGTMTSPTAVPSGVNLLVLGGKGYDGTSFATRSNALIAFQTAENFTSSAQGTAIQFETTPIGSNYLNRTERMIITANGNVGIGTSSPGQMLSVAGDILGHRIIGSYFISTSTTASSLRYASTTALTVSGTNGLTLGTLNGPLQAINGAVSASSTISVAYGGTGVSTAPSYGQLLVGDGNGNYSLTATSSLGILASSAIGLGSVGQIPYYSTAAQAITATSSLFLSTRSFVGIGTTTPNSALSVFSTASPQFQLAYDKDNYLTTGVSSSGGITMAVNGTSGGFAITNPQPTAVGSGTGTAAPLGLSVTGGIGGNSLDTNIGVGGIGGGIQLNAGTGGTALLSTFSETGGAGGAVSLTGGTGGVAASPTVAFMSRLAGAGGAVTIAGGNGGAATNGGASSVNTAGAGGAFILNGGTGGNASGATTNNGGAGGSLYITGGAGGTGSSANGNAGNVYLGYNSSSVLGNVYFGNQNISYISSTGNFGIATTSPYAKLSVAGEVVGQNFTATSTTATSTLSGGLVVAGTSGLNVLQNGKVAIGAANPTGKFGVTLNTTFSLPQFASQNVAHFVGADASDVVSQMDVFGGHGVIDIRRANGTLASPSALVSDDEIGAFSFRGYADSASYASGGGRAAVTAYAAENWSSTNMGSYLLLSTTPLGSTALTTGMKIGPDGVSGNNSDFGVGTFVPNVFGYNPSIQRTLTILGGQNVGSRAVLELAARADNNVSGSVIGQIDFNAQSQSSTKRIAMIMGLLTGTASGDYGSDLAFYTKADGSSSVTEKFRINSAGNVGVGTTSPSKTLSVQGNSYVSGTSFFGGAITATSTLNVTGLTTLGNASTTQIGSTGSAYFATLGGSLGVGTTSPWANLSINGTSTQTVLPLFAVASSTGNATSTAFIIDANGKIGIGTSSPLQQLSVAGSAYFTGNVGIATSSPGALFSVAGNSLFGIGSGSTFAANFGTFVWSQSATTTILDNTSGAWSISTSTDPNLLPIISITTKTGQQGTTSINSGLSVGGGLMSFDYTSGFTSVNGLQVSGVMNFDTDAGVIGWADLPISSSATANTPQSYTATIGSTPVLTVYGEADGSGNSKNLRVGIGSTTPFATLSVSGSTTSATSWAFAVADVASTTRFLIQDAGNVGIGTTSPGQKLSVAGDILSSNTITGQSFIANSTSATSTFYGFIDVLGTGTNSTSTISSNLWVKGTLRSNLSYVGDLIFANNFAFTEALPINSTTTQGLYLNNQKGNRIFGIDENGNMNITGDICSKNVACVNESLSKLSSDVGALASSTASLQAGLTTTSSVQSLADAIVALDLKVDSFIASSTLNVDSIIASTSLALASSTDFISRVSSSTANVLVADSSFVNALANVVKNVLSSTQDWVMDKFTAKVAYLNRVEAETVAISKGMEIVDQINGSVWCVTIKNGDWNKVQGSCASVASTTNQVIVNPTPIPTPASTPIVIVTPEATTSPVVIPDSGSASTTATSSDSTVSTTSSETASSTTSTIESTPVPTSTPTPSPTVVEPTPTVTPVATPVENSNPEPTSVVPETSPVTP